MISPSGDSEPPWVVVSPLVAVDPLVVVYTWMENSDGNSLVDF